MEYKVIWHFNGGVKETSDYGKKASMYQKEFVQAHNAFCEIANNGLTDALNKKWDELHPEKDYDNDRYVAFIRCGYQAAIECCGLQTKHMTYSIDEEAQLLGHPETGGDLFITLKEM